MHERGQKTLMTLFILMGRLQYFDLTMAKFAVAGLDEAQ